MNELYNLFSVLDVGYKREEVSHSGTISLSFLLFSYVLAYVMDNDH